MASMTASLSHCDSRAFRDLLSSMTAMSPTFEEDPASPSPASSSSSSSDGFSSVDPSSSAPSAPESTADLPQIPPETAEQIPSPSKPCFQHRKAKSLSLKHVSFSIPAIRLRPAPRLPAAEDYEAAPGDSSGETNRPLDFSSADAFDNGDNGDRVSALRSFEDVWASVAGVEGSGGGGEEEEIRVSLPRARSDAAWQVRRVEVLGASLGTPKGYVNLEGEGEGQGEGEKGKIEGSETRREVERDGVKGGGEKAEIGREGEVGEGEKLLHAKRKAGDLTEELPTPLRTKWPRRWIHPFPPMRLLDDLNCTEEEPMECNGSSVEDRLFCEMRKKSFLEANLDALKNEMEMKADQMMRLEAEYDESVVHFERVRKSACARSEVEQLKREAAAVEEGNRAFVEGTWRAAQQTHAAAEGRLAEAMKVKGVVEEEARKLERVEAESNKALLKAIEEKNELAVLLRERKELLDQIAKMEDGEEVMNDAIVNLTRKRSELSDEVDHLEQMKAQLQNGAAAEEGAAGERTMGGLQANKRRRTTAS